LADKKLLLGVKQFNLDPKKGLEFLEKAGFLDSTSADEVANFLYREGRLSKKQIGAFIGDHRDFNKEVLKAFVAKHEFMNLILVQALRQFLWSFRLVQFY
jgi:Sec7-like guanine-nucleotide exchange factor